MSEELKNENSESATKVVEKRVTTTIIRRRAKKVVEPEVPVQPAQEESAVESATQQVLQPEAAPQETAEKQPAAEPKPEQIVQEATPQEIPSEKAEPRDEGGESVAADEGLKLKAPSEAEKKIGVVGHIVLERPAPTPQQTTVAADGTVEIISLKEDWRDKFKRTRRKKSRDELEMEAIQRAGGLKKYTEDDMEPSAAAVGDRVFQPAISGRKKKTVRKDFKKTQITERKAIKKIIRIEGEISVSALSQTLGVKAADIIKRLISLGVMATINQHIDVDTAQLIAEENGFTVENTAFREEEILAEPEARASAGNFVPRAPVVTVMGHVDHGKTSVLDYIRKSSVADREAGGITQHIGAYEVKHSKGNITFLDTPGHEAFTMMRARGAQLTDIVILVIAADDGIMPQTIEAIDHSKAAGVPIIVAINKMDKHEAQPDRIRQALTEHGLVPEEWGGDVICVHTSAKTGEGIDRLLEMVLLQAEMLDLKADPTIRAKGVVIEARLDKGRGPVATVLIQEGTLKVGSYIVCGSVDGKVRAMFDHEGKPVKEAHISQPVEILGLSGTPTAGDDMVGVADDRSAKMVVDQRREKMRKRGLSSDIHISLEDLSARLSEGESKELGVIIKSDVHGSAEAVKDALEKLSTDKVKLKVLHSAVGGIVESDVMLAAASEAVILGFNVQPDGKARSAAAADGVEIRTYRIIYEMIDDVKKAMAGLLSPDEKVVEIGAAEVRNVFRISKVGAIAGCYVIQGKIQRNAFGRLVRDQVVVFEGKLSSLKRFKDDAKEVAEGYECGIGLENFNDIKIGDVIEAYIIEKTAAVL
ncbi:MAG TPA: translation initiation factor IF-2 [bacterium]|nr:translation initiation factor IF-2 [Myxococcales bacterium]OQA61593.1 MAG: Translation initiation factor IF-2 [bacterium ADurb.Bin270]HPW45808.1 translation initiation factor IF-2 [bacterium]HQG13535.1 translation initiation factor IF-2 [bacterium]